MTSERLAARRRRWHEVGRRLRGRPHVVHYFHDLADPYSLLAALALPALAGRRGVVVEAHLVPPPPDWAAPERALLDAHARRDAAVLARHCGLNVPAFDRAMAPAALALGQSRLAEALARGTFIETAAAITAAAWRGETGAPAADAASLLAAGAALRDRLGHYLGATFHYAGEWYWGLDRLHYLERRLDALGAPGEGPSPRHPRPVLRLDPALADRLAGRELDLFFSFRSPYSYIVLPRAFALADHYGATLNLRFILPMVMRGLPVPLSKRLYIVRDTKREAGAEGLPFGRIADPLGVPVERGLAVLHHALGLGGGQGRAFALSFLQGAFAEGIDAGGDAGLALMAARAGLDAKAALAAPRDEGWRAVAEANRQAMAGLGLWGVPSLRFGATAAWGQDRLWLIEETMIAAAERV
ncbi:2-hydroxychromene-2-carboxylate isomerase [Zavarzinia compransoris]|uniref:2-hydroxychromene-2-carboxylate isomerase n=2 Tax=Zavarzinia compransoris TaxID=1264899 RepID=A0A317DUM8_9PROT|nr:2-hydroxychromene-2-carboxylate isomerase [Zavarzinia compransoris]